MTTAKTDTPQTAGLKQQLRTSGYAFFGANQVELDPTVRWAADWFAGEFDRLPADPYCPDGTRFRRYGVFLLDVGTGELRPTTIHTYLQSSFFNSEHGDVARAFAPLDRPVARNTFLRALIDFDARQLTLPESRTRLPLCVGVHMLRLAPCAGQPAGAFPRLHKDGEWFTYSHLIRRVGVTGGDGLVTDNAKVPLWRGQQQHFLDTFAVVDAEVYHHVDPVELADGAEVGFRDVLLIDFTPLVPEIRPPSWACRCATVQTASPHLSARCERRGEGFRPAA